MDENIEIKRKLMFATSDDLYFCTYNVLILLHFLKCKGSPTKFKDYKKMAFLIQFVANDKLVLLLDKSEKLRNETDMLLLSQAYTDGLLRINQIKRVLFVLEKNQFIQGSGKSLNTIWLTDKYYDSDFFNKDTFEYEKNNILKLKTKIKRLTSIKTETFLDEVFLNHGVTTWLT